MPIDTTILEQHGEKQLIVMSPHETLEASIETLKTKGYSENEAYLIVLLAEKEAVVMRFADLWKQIIQPLGYDSWQKPLQHLPLNRADLVVRTDIPQSGLEVVDWVAARPESKVVVVDDTGVVGLLTNHNRSGGFFDSVLSLLRLHGEVNRSIEPQQTFTQLVPPASCPACGQQDYAMYDVTDKKYYCNHCDHKQDGPW